MENLDYKNENIANEYKRVMHSKGNNINLHLIMINSLIHFI